MKFLILVAAFQLAGCSSGGSIDRRVNSSAQIDQNGGQKNSGDVSSTDPYTANCATCHGPLAESSKLGRSATQIAAAIRDVKFMQNLSFLTAVEIGEIADLLATSARGNDDKKNPPMDGLALFQTYCEACHGSIQDVSAKFTDANKIEDAAQSVTNMSHLIPLLGQQAYYAKFVEIAKAAAKHRVTTTSDAEETTTTVTLPNGETTTTTLDTGPTGAQLYAINCASCHLELEKSLKKNATAAAITNAIKTVVMMKNHNGGSLSRLTSREIGKIASALVATTTTTTTLPTTTLLTTTTKIGEATSTLVTTTTKVEVTTTTVPPLSGEVLYQNNCQGCHLELAQSQKRGASATDIANAIKTIGGMINHNNGQLGKLTTAEIAKIAEALSNNPTTTTTTTKAPTTTTKAGVTTTTLVGATTTTKVTTTIPPTTTTTKVVVEKTGPELYAINCQGCHGPLATSQKLNKTLADIRTAQGDVDRMAFVATLSDATLNKIVEALKVQSGIVRNPRLAQRFQMLKRLREIFEPATMADSSVAADVTKILNEEVANQAAIWSGTCGRNDGYCPGNDLINNTAADLTVEPLASPLRRGQLIATCNRIVTTRSSKAVDLLVRHVTKTFAKPTKQHVQDMWFWFYPTSAAPSEATLNAFVSLVEKMNTDKKTVLEIWTLVVDVMCRQPNGETL